MNKRPIKLEGIEEEEIPFEKWNPIVITGGKEQPPENWLINLPRRSVFLVAPRSKLSMTEQQKQALKASPAVEEYHIMYHSEGGHTWLLSQGEMPKPGEPKLWVNTLNFSRMFDCKEVLYDPTRNGQQLVSDEGTEEAKELLPPATE
jgi:hypothetical protein